MYRRIGELAGGVLVALVAACGGGRPSTETPPIRPILAALPTIRPPTPSTWKPCPGSEPAAQQQRPSAPEDLSDMRMVGWSNGAQLIRVSTPPTLRCAYGAVIEPAVGAAGDPLGDLAPAEDAVRGGRVLAYEMQRDPAPGAVPQADVFVIDLETGQRQLVGRCRAAMSTMTAVAYPFVDLRWSNAEDGRASVVGLSDGEPPTVTVDVATNCALDGGWIVRAPCMAP